MSTITKERIELFIKSPLENGLTRGEQMELARIALASLEAEPVGAFHIAEQQVDGTSDYTRTVLKQNFRLTMKSKTTALLNLSFSRFWRMRSIMALVIWMKMMMEKSS